MATRIDGAPDVVVDDVTWRLLSSTQATGLHHRMLAALRRPPGLRRMGQVDHQHAVALSDLGCQMEATDGLYGDVVGREPA